MGAAPSSRNSAEANGVKCSRCACSLPANNWSFFDYTEELGIIVFYSRGEQRTKIAMYIRRKNTRQWWYYEYSCMRCLRQKDWKTFKLMESEMEGRALALSDESCSIQ